MKTRFESCKRGDGSDLVANDGKIRESLEFSGMTRIDYPVMRLLARRKASKWGFLNKGFFKGKYLPILRQDGFYSITEV
jgi:hypothetical protein